jgi:hypothetical protein
LTVALVLAFAILPTLAKISVLSRIALPFYYVISDTASYRLSFDEAVQRTTRLDIFAGQERDKLWKEGVENIIQNPIGYGLLYLHRIPIRLGTKPSVAHNIFLSIVLTSGIVMILLFLLFAQWLLSFLRLLKNRDDVFAKSIGVVLCGSLASFLFLDDFLSRWLWIVTAMGFSLYYRYKLMTPFSNAKN